MSKWYSGKSEKGKLGAGKEQERLMKTLRRMNFRRAIVSWLLVCAMMVGLILVMGGNVYANTYEDLGYEITKMIQHQKTFGTSLLQDINHYKNG